MSQEQRCGAEYARRVAALFAIAFFCTVARAQEVPGCGALENAFGPFDYRDSRQAANLKLVETFHFTAKVESLEGGQSGNHPIPDISYTLRAFPNHHRALSSIDRYEMTGGKLPDGPVPSVECYFKRAVAFRPDDYVVHLLYGIYLNRRSERDRAKGQYEEALRLAPDSADTNYTAGLFFLNIGDLPRAKELAEKAYAEGYPLPGLRNKILAAENHKTKH